MNHKKLIKQRIVLLFLILFVLTTFACMSHRDRFSFVFLADIHVQPELHAKEGFQQAVQVVNELKPDFVLTGGDLIMDANSQSFDRADELYTLYRNISGQLEMPV
jgi:predicted MPP superfamily phosphohydrolase